MDRRCAFWIDRGGTFTDVIGRWSDGEEVSLKLLSASPSYPDPAVEAMRRILDVPPGAPFPAARVEVIKMGTTVATNALLERKGEPTLLVITRGLRDQLEIGYQARPDIFARRIVKLPELFAAVKAALLENGLGLVDLFLGGAKDWAAFGVLLRAGCGLG